MSAGSFFSSVDGRQGPRIADAKKGAPMSAFRYQQSDHGSTHAARQLPYFCDNTHFTSVRASASLTWALAGIGIAPHTPEPPFNTFWVSLSSASFDRHIFLPHP